LPKKGLLDALSAQICSLSLNVADACLEAITGDIQAFLSPLAAAATSSVRDTAMPSNPFSPLLPGNPDVRFA
jgi:hypothetical protein